MPRRSLSAGTILSAVAGAAVAALAGCAEPNPGDLGVAVAPCSSATATATTRVLITQGQFAPYCTKVPVGVRVTFTNADFVEHTVTADAGQPEPFDSPILYPGQQFEHAFTAPETVRVHCRLTPEVSGKVIVE